MCTYAFYFQNIDVGGCELLIEKLAKALSTSSKVYICCQFITDDMKNRFYKSNIEIQLFKHWNYGSEFADWAIQIRKNLYEIAFLWDDYIFLYNKRKFKSKTVFYNVHYKTLSMGSEYKVGILQNLVKKTCFELIRQYSAENRILATDEQTVKYSNDYYQELLKSNNLNIPILRIPLDIIEIDDNLLRRKSAMKELNILSIARADFPFKGYILGLIDCVKKMNIGIIASLTIITYGQNVELIYNKVQELNSDIRDKIHLVGKTDYDELQKYMLESNLYIGMGTTLLDASVRGIISIPVKSYTYELISDHFFYDDIFQVTADQCSVNRIEQLMLQVSKMSPNEYYTISKSTIKKIEDTYGSSIIASQLEDIFSQLGFNSPSFKSRINDFIMNTLKRIVKQKGILESIKKENKKHEHNA